MGNMSENTIPKKKTTLKDIAEEVGVSINTASCVLNPRSVPRHVAAGTRRAILETARRMNYQRNVAASSLAGGKTKTIGVLIPRLAHPFYAPIVESFEQMALKQGYQCFVGSTGNDGLASMHYIEGFLSRGVDGILMASGWENSEIRDGLAMIFQTNTPVLFIDHVWDEHPGPLVSGNHYMGGELLGRHLIDVGHRSMLFMAQDYTYQFQSVKMRLRGLRSAIEAAELPSSTLQETSADIGMRDGQWIAASEMLSARVIRILGTPDAPSAIVCSNDIIANLLIQGLHEKGVRVPEDVAITGYDDLVGVTIMSQFGIFSPSCLGSMPSLTTVRQPLHEIGQRAAMMLAQKMRGDAMETPMEDLVDVSLVVRASSALPSQRL